MGDAVVVQFLLENLKQFLLYHAKLIRDAKAQADSLDKDLRLFQAKLQDSTDMIWKQNKSAREMVRQIRDAVHKMEDAIDDSVAKRGHIINSKNFISRIFRFVSILPGLINVANDVQELSTKVKNMMNVDRVNFAGGGQDQEGDSRWQHDTTTSLVGEDTMIGFEDDEKLICGYLREEKEAVDVISIVGMPGLGKTKLAGKIFNDMKKEGMKGIGGIDEPKKLLFSTAIRVDLSPYEYDRERVLRGMLDDFPDDVVTSETRQKARTKNAQQLARMVKTHLSKSDSFLVVLDNIWNPRVWAQLKEAFPKTHKAAGKILITTQDEQVALFSNPNRKPHKLPFLTSSQSWDLLKLVIFDRKECPTNLMEQGKRIAAKCDGLPHLIVAVGDYLRRRRELGGVTEEDGTWRRVSENLNTCLDENDDDLRVFYKYALSYKNLPYYLRPCFLYLGIFPQDYKIPIGLLVRLWIAEGFIPAKMGWTLEQTARDYLHDLIRKNLVIVDEVSPDGGPKKCHVHFMLREFCRVEASIDNENFFQQMTRSTEEEDARNSEQALSIHRRITIDSSVGQFLLRKRTGAQVRSFLCFHDDTGRVQLKDVDISSIRSAFKLLRVLAAEPITFNKLPTDEWIKLVHLRFVVLSIDSNVIPKDISRLWNMQTFIVYTSSQTLDIRANIWKMEKLRHVKTNVSTKLPSAIKGKEGSNLQTLGKVSEGSCTKEAFTRARRLKKLGIHGQLSDLFDAEILKLLENLEKLKLEKDSSTTATSGTKPLRLPKTVYFPEKLERLTLCGTHLPWRDMSILGQLDLLKVLKLKDSAFTGDAWDAKHCNFPELLVLHIEGTDLRFWKLVDEKQFQKLHCLVLWNCEKLEEFPLDKIKSLRKLNLKRVTNSVKEIAKKCRWENRQEQGGNKGSSSEEGEELCHGGGDE